MKTILRRTVAYLLIFVLLFCLISCTAEKSNLEDNLKAKATSHVTSYYRVLYGVYPYVNIATVRANGDGTWTLAGKATLQNDYGDSYVANWKISYEVISDTEFAQIDYEYGEPLRSR